MRTHTASDDLRPNQRGRDSDVVGDVGATAVRRERPDHRGAAVCYRTSYVTGGVLLLDDARETLSGT